MIDQFQNIKSWSEVFDQVDEDEKKMILSHMIKKITVDKDYNIKIYFFIAFDEVKDALQENEANGRTVMVEEYSDIQELVA